MNDESCMRRAIELAREGQGLTSPGAMVGCVIVNKSEVVGEGVYTWDGVKHAEVLALEQAGEAARGATVYLNLEPCSHQGRTPPCVEVADPDAVPVCRQGHLHHRKPSGPNATGRAGREPHAEAVVVVAVRCGRSILGRLEGSFRCRSEGRPMRDANGGRCAWNLPK